MVSSGEEILKAKTALQNGKVSVKARVRDQLSSNYHSNYQTDAPCLKFSKTKIEINRAANPDRPLRRSKRLKQVHLKKSIAKTSPITTDSASTLTVPTPKSI